MTPSDIASYAATLDDPEELHQLAREVFVAFMSSESAPGCPAAAYSWARKYLELRDQVRAETEVARAH